MTIDDLARGPEEILEALLQGKKNLRGTLQEKIHFERHSPGKKFERPCREKRNLRGLAEE